MISENNYLGKSRINYSLLGVSGSGSRFQEPGTHNKFPRKDNKSVCVNFQLSQKHR